MLIIFTYCNKSVSSIYLLFYLIKFIKLNNVVLLGAPLLSDSSRINEKERELSNALDEIIQNYLKLNITGCTKRFNFEKNLKKYKPNSKEIFNYLTNNPAIQHYEVIIGNCYEHRFRISKNKSTTFEWYIKTS